MKKFIIGAFASVALLSASAPAFASWCYWNGYCVPTCGYVWNGWNYVYLCN